MVNGTPQRLPNVNKGYQYAVGDTVVPPDGNDFNNFVYISYIGSYSGQWHTNSQYTWYSSIDGSSQAGTFIPNALADFRLMYTSPSSGPQDTIALTATDSLDGVLGYATYVMHFHNEIEDWTRTSTVAHPAGDPYPNNPDWTLHFVIANGGTSDLQNQLAAGYSLTKSMTGEISSEQSLDVPGLNAFKVNEKISVGESETATTTQTITFTAKPGKKLYCYAGQTWEHRTGTCSMWASNGYSGDSAWDGDWVGTFISTSTHEENYP